MAKAWSSASVSRRKHVESHYSSHPCGFLIVCAEQLEWTEIAFVHLDYETDHAPEHGRSKSEPNMFSGSATCSLAPHLCLLCSFYWHLTALLVVVRSPAAPVSTVPPQAAELEPLVSV